MSGLGHDHKAKLSGFGLAAQWLGFSAAGQGLQLQQINQKALVRVHISAK